MKVNTIKLQNFAPIEIKITIENQQELDHFKMIFGQTTPYDIGALICKYDKTAKPDNSAISRILSGIYYEIKQYF